jgi:hypothetical protein
LAEHQFGQPEIDARDPQGQRRVLRIHPQLKRCPRELILAVSYLVPLINYGESVISDEHCCLYGATLLGLSTTKYYQRICALADRLSLIPAHPAARCNAACCLEPPSTPSAL